MKPNIAGDYRSGENSVHIAHSGHNAWQTTYSSGHNSRRQRLPAFAHNYMLDLPHGCIGTAQFDDQRLVGFFQPGTLTRAFTPGLNGFTPLDPFSNGPLLFAQFTATLREDGNFDVTIEQFDGRSSGRKHKPGRGPLMFEPEMERIETMWVRQ